MSRIIKDREIIAVLEEFVTTQEKLLLEFQKQVHPLENTSLQQPKTGEIVATNETWKFRKHGVGICFKGNQSGKIIDAHTAIVDHKTAFDAWRLAQYLLSTKKYTEILWNSHTYYIADEDGDFNDDDIEKLLQDLEQANIIKSVSNQLKLYELNKTVNQSEKNISDKAQINKIFGVLLKTTNLNKNHLNINNLFKRNTFSLKEELSAVISVFANSFFLTLSYIILIIILILGLLIAINPDNQFLTNLVAIILIGFILSILAALIEALIKDFIKKQVTSPSLKNKNKNHQQVTSITRKEAEIEIIELALDAGVEIIDKSLIILEEITKRYENRIQKILLWLPIIAIGLATIIIGSYDFDLIRKSGWVYFLALILTRIVNLSILSDKNEWFFSCKYAKELAINTKK